jgi:N-acyl-L-homoserine lactone synthetase
MIHIVTEKNRDLYDDLLREMHRLRKVHFVDERGWSAMTVKDGGEYDDYDDAKAVYLLAVEPDGSVACSMRMRPAEVGSILQDVFPHLIAADEPSIAKPDAWEISRYFASSAARGKSGFKRRAEIRLASLEVALEHGVKRLVGMIDIEMLAPMLNGSGWRVRPLGLPAPYDEGVAQAIEVQVSRGALIDLEESQGLHSPISFEVDKAVVPNIPPQEIEALLRASNDLGGRQQMLVRLVKRVIELQDHSSEDQLIATVEYLSELIERGVAASL